MFTVIVWVIGTVVLLWMANANLVYLELAFETSVPLGLLMLVVSIIGWVTIFVLVF